MPSTSTARVPHRSLRSHTSYQPSGHADAILSASHYVRADSASTTAIMQHEHERHLDRADSLATPVKAADDTPVASFKASCVRKTRRTTPGVNVGICTLTPTTFRFTADYLVANPSEAVLNLPLQHITHIHRASYRRILPNAILVRCRNFPEYLFAFASRRDQLTAMHRLELSVHDATTTAIVVPSLHPPHHPSSKRPNSVDSQLSEDRQHSDDRRLSSDDHSSADLNSRALSSNPDLSVPEPMSLPVSSSRTRQCAAIPSAAKIQPNARLGTLPQAMPRSHSHPGDSTSSLTLARGASADHQQSKYPTTRESSYSSWDTPSDSSIDKSPSYLINLKSLKLRDNVANRRGLIILAYFVSLTVILIILMGVFVHLNHLSNRITSLTRTISTH